MALTKEEILDAIASMTVLEVSELIKMMEEKFGVSAAAVALPLLLKKRPNSTWFSPKLVLTKSPLLRLFAN